MKAKELKLQYDNLWKRYNSLGEAVERLEADNQRLLALVDTLQANRKQLQAKDEIRAQVINAELEKMNVRHNSDLEEIKRLKVEANGN